MEALGVEMLLKVKIGDIMTPIAGLLTDEFVVDSETIDITNKDSQSWRTLIAGGRRTVDISCEAFILDDEAQTVLKQAAVDDAVLICEVTDGLDLGVSGTFKIGVFDDSGSYDGAERFTLTLHSINAVIQGEPVPEVAASAEAWGFTSYSVGGSADQMYRLGLRPFTSHSIT